jgi:hypothetical protein
MLRRYVSAILSNFNVACEHWQSILRLSIACPTICLAPNYPRGERYGIPQWLILDLLEHLLTVSPRPAYPFGPAFPCSVEFWMMSIAVPLGMGK